MPDDEGLRERLAVALHGHSTFTEAVDAVLPVVERYAETARVEGRADALNAAWHEVDDDEAAELLARRAVEWERQAAGLRADALTAGGTEPHPAHWHDETGAGRG